MLGSGRPARAKDFALGNGNGNGHGYGQRGAHGADAADGDRSTSRPRSRRSSASAIQRALEASGGNRRQAASLLGISLRTLFYKMRRLPVQERHV